MLQAYGNLRPQIDPAARVAETAVVVGEVSVEAGASLWYGAVLDGGALAAIDIYNRFVNLTADFIDSAEEVQLDARISPAQNQGNVYAYKNSKGETLLTLG